MPISVPHGKTDEIIESIKGVLQRYQQDHELARIDIYRQNSVSVRIRIVDPHFADQDRPQRHALVWRYLDELPEEVVSDISTLLLLTLAETKTSFANFESDDPTPSDL